MTMVRGGETMTPTSVSSTDKEILAKAQDTHGNDNLEKSFVQGETNSNEVCENGDGRNVEDFEISYRSDDVSTLDTLDLNKWRLIKLADANNERFPGTKMSTRQVKSIVAAVQEEANRGEGEKKDEHFPRITENSLWSRMTWQNMAQSSLWSSSIAPLIKKGREYVVNEPIKSLSVVLAFVIVLCSILPVIFVGMLTSAATAFVCACWTVIIASTLGVILATLAMITLATIAFFVSIFFGCSTIKKMCAGFSVSTTTKADVVSEDCTDILADDDNQS